MVDIRAETGTEGSYLYLSEVDTTLIISPILHSQQAAMSQAALEGISKHILANFKHQPESLMVTCCLLEPFERQHLRLAFSKKQSGKRTTNHSPAAVLTIHCPDAHDRRREELGSSHGAVSVHRLFAAWPSTKPRPGRRGTNEWEQLEV